MGFSSKYRHKKNIERIELTPWFYYDVIKTRKRIIHAPSPALKKAQRTILRKYFKEYWVFNSVKYAASVHCSKKWLMKLDIKDFYNSVTEEQIRQVLNDYVSMDKCKNTDRSREVSAEVEQIFSICTINGKLPTGAPTSPYIANLLLKDFDYDIQKFCNIYGVTYSRYMDDLFFSTDNPQYILSLVELEVIRQFKELGFGVNTDKIKYISSNKRQQVLGLGVNNKKPVLTKEDKRKYRAYFYNLISPVQFNKIKNYKEHEKELLGHLAYIKSVDEEFFVRIAFYIFNLLVRLNIRQKHCFKKLIKSIEYNKAY